MTGIDCIGLPGAWVYLRWLKGSVLDWGLAFMW